MPPKISDKIISIVNQKGGVGKTTTSVNLATLFAIMKNNVLLIDLDSQGNSSTGLGINQSLRNVTICDVLNQRNDIETAIIDTKVQNLRIIPADNNLSSFESDMATYSDNKYILKNILQNIKQKFDYIIIDCPPGLNLLTINALIACSDVIIPMQCDFFSLEGLSHLIKTVQSISSDLNPDIIINGILFTMYDKRNLLTLNVENDVRTHLGELVYNTRIPKNVKLSEAPSHGQAGVIYDHKCPGSLAYIELAKEVIHRINNK